MGIPMIPGRSWRYGVLSPGRLLAGTVVHPGASFPSPHVSFWRWPVPCVSLPRRSHALRSAPVVVRGVGRWTVFLPSRLVRGGGLPVSTVSRWCATVLRSLDFPPPLLPLFPASLRTRGEGVWSLDRRVGTRCCRPHPSVPACRARAGSSLMHFGLSFCSQGTGVALPSRGRRARLMSAPLGRL